MPWFQLQTIHPKDIEANTLFFYEELNKKFLSEKMLISQQNLVELRFEDLEANPLNELHRIYTELHLDGFKAAEPAFRKLIANQSSYRKNTYEPDNIAMKKVKRHWQFAIDAWSYDLADL